MRSILLMRAVDLRVRPTARRAVRGQSRTLARMALIACPDCGKHVSDTAPACLGCGRPFAPPVVQAPVFVQGYAAPPPKTGLGCVPIFLIVLGVLALGFLAFVLFVRSRVDDTQRMEALTATRVIHGSVVGVRCRSSRREVSDCRGTPRKEGDQRSYAGPRSVEHAVRDRVQGRRGDRAQLRPRPEGEHRRRHSHARPEVIARTPAAYGAPLPARICARPCSTAAV